ncbi:MAG: hypothetical protein H6Q28_1306, partial [Bacteroidetes bacterium]|nr:hypothetical protein [Bacteroidota bacterium]
PDWKSFGVVRTFRDATYRIEVDNPGRTGHGVAEIRLNGSALSLPGVGMPVVLPVMPAWSENVVAVTLRQSPPTEQPGS